MTQIKALELLEDVRADYVGMLRDLHALRHSSRPFTTDRWPLVAQMDAAIRDLNRGFSGRKCILDLPEASDMGNPISQS